MQTIVLVVVNLLYHDIDNIRSIVQTDVVGQCKREIEEKGIGE